MEAPVSFRIQLHAFPTTALVCSHIYPFDAYHTPTDIFGTVLFKNSNGRLCRPCRWSSPTLCPSAACKNIDHCFNQSSPSAIIILIAFKTLLLPWSHQTTFYPSLVSGRRNLPRFLHPLPCLCCLKYKLYQCQYLLGYGWDKVDCTPSLAEVHHNIWSYTDTHTWPRPVDLVNALKGFLSYAPTSALQVSMVGPYKEGHSLEGG